MVPRHIAARFRFGSTLPVLAVLLVGVVRWGNGFHLGRPIGFLTAALAGTIVLFIVMLNFRRNRHLRTFAGDRALRELRRPTLRDAATAVALDGVGRYRTPGSPPRCSGRSRRRADVPPASGRPPVAASSSEAAAVAAAGEDAAVVAVGGGRRLRWRWLRRVTAFGGDGCGRHPSRGSESASGGDRRST
ncbi:hypothetical protein GCM10018954_078250 [Kutzneria kofuensis]